MSQEPLEVNMKTIDVQPMPPDQTLAMTRVESRGAVGRAMSIEELKANLNFIKEVMKSVMKEGQDYGKIPGTGDKPTLLQPGAQKLLMTFQLTDSVKKEVLREFPQLPLHREYEFTVTVTSAAGRAWDGVGTCSTLESKYRYRKQERRCPKCGKNTIIQGKAEYGGGWLCWKKKGGCGVNFSQDDLAITRQPSGKVENDNIADTWNTVRKIAFKRALVAAAINATNTSELWTQDLDDKAEDEPSAAAVPASAPSSAPRRTSAPAQPAAPRYATENTRAWMIRKFADISVAQEFFVKLGWILETETLQDMSLGWVPVNNQQVNALLDQYKKFENGDEITQPYPINQAEPEAPKDKPAAQEKPAAASPPPAPAPPPKPKDPEWWRGIVIPIPPKDMKRDEYLKNPQTIGQLYEWRHDKVHATRLFGFIKHFEPKDSWTGTDGNVHKRSAAEMKTEALFREALDACADYAEKHSHDDTEPPPHAAGPEPEMDDVPF